MSNKKIRDENYTRLINRENVRIRIKMEPLLNNQIINQASIKKYNSNTICNLLLKIKQFIKKLKYIGKWRFK